MSRRFLLAASALLVLAAGVALTEEVKACRHEGAI